MSKKSRIFLIIVLIVFIIFCAICSYHDNLNAKLIENAGAGNAKKVKRLINSWTNIDARNKNDEIAFLVAVKNNNLDIVKILLNAGADINIKNNYRRTALDIAAKNGYSDIVEYLLKRKINLENNSALVCAVENGHADTTKILIKYGFNLNEQYYDETPLTTAVSEGRKKIVKLLIESGVDLNLKSGYGEVPLMLAVKNDYKDIAKMMITAGADVNIVDHDELPLIYALKRGDIEIAKLLIKAGSKVNIIDLSTVKKSLSSFDRASVLQGNLSMEVDGRKVSAGEMIDFFDKVDKVLYKNGTTALMYAVKSGNIELINMMIDAGANVKAVDKNGDTAVAYTDNPKIINLLKKKE